MKIEERSDLTTLNARNEYLEDGLRCAARISWLDVCDTYYASVAGSPLRFREAPPYWVENEARAIHRTLVNGGPLDEWRNEQVRWYAIRLLGLNRTYGASSARAEQSA